MQPGLAEQRSKEREAERQKLQAIENAKRVRHVNEMLDRNVDWYAVIVPPQKERVAELIMERVGFDAFVPIEFRYRRVHSRQKVKRFVPYIMASRYVFVGFDRANVPWHDLFSLKDSCGVLIHSVVSLCGAPVAIPTSTMRSLFAKTGEEDARKSAVRLNRSIVTGDKVMLTKGAYAGTIVTLEGIEEGKGKHLIEMFGKFHMVESPLDDMEPI
jgi:transcriptional antiterminator NusG